LQRGQDEGAQGEEDVLFETIRERNDVQRSHTYLKSSGRTGDGYRRSHNRTRRPTEEIQRRGLFPRLCTKQDDSFVLKGWLSGFIRKRVKTLSHDHKILGRPPQEYWRRLCYHVVQSNAFERYFFVVTVLNAIFVGIDQYYHPSLISDAAKPPHDISLHYVIVATDLFFCIHYIGEFVMKILANSWLHIWPDGFRKYFK
jgi:hypothetical protein